MSVKVRPYRRGGWEVDIQWFTADGRRQRERRRVAVTARSAAPVERFVPEPER